MVLIDEAIKMGKSIEIKTKILKFQQYALLDACNLDAFHDVRRVY